jgi:hypothetical protein
MSIDESGKPEHVDQAFGTAASDRDMLKRTYPTEQLDKFIRGKSGDEVDCHLGTLIHEAAAYLVAHPEVWTNFNGLRLQAHGRTAEELVALYRYEMDVRRAGSGA